MSDVVQKPERPLFRVLEPFLTTQRLAPYLAAANGNEKLALQLYQWNIEISGAAHEALHVFEVVLRNAIDAQLSIWNAQQVDRQSGARFGRDWLLDPAPLLRRLVRQSELDSARARADRALRHHARTATHGDLLAQLSLGTWRFLLPDRDPGRNICGSTQSRTRSPASTAPSDSSSHQSTASTDCVTASPTSSHYSDPEQSATGSPTCAP
ncbi:hypothetical protein [Microbacterium sp.]|jgi:hypothetical protein|uniref:hypothetical protein n=1 Tax=Microbacterium sp. TaxID=51671 RepID=UPI0037C5B451